MLHEAAVAELAQKQRVPLVDLVALFREHDRTDGIKSDALFSDHIHPNAAGQLIIAEALFALVQADYAERLASAGPSAH